ncbi:hypothetical protein ACOMHN_054717 [Nucella lapillus]
MDMFHHHLLFFIILSGVVRAQHHVDEGNLLTAILGSYNTDVRPDTTFTIYITPVPLSLNSLVRYNNDHDHDSNTQG